MSDVPPIAPPTVSGWYVVEWKEDTDVPSPFVYLNIHSRKGVCISLVENGFFSDPWEEYRKDMVRISGPLDLQALLEGKNK